MDYPCSLDHFSIESASVTASAIINFTTVPYLIQAAAQHMLASCTQHLCHGVMLDFTVRLECQQEQQPVLSAQTGHGFPSQWLGNGDDVPVRRLACTHSGGVGRWTTLHQEQRIDVPQGVQFFCGECVFVEIYSKMAVLRTSCLKSSRTCQHKLINVNLF